MKEITKICKTVCTMANELKKDLLRDIRRYCKQMNVANKDISLGGESKIALSDFFQESTYQNNQNKK